jgi:hypothetical protein
MIFAGVRDNKPPALSTIHLEKLIVAKLVKEFPAFYGIRNFIIVFITAHHWTLT